MKIQTGQKGKPQRVLDGYLYIIDKNDKKIYWNVLETRKGEQSNTELRKQALLRGVSLSKKSTKAISREKRLYGVPGGICP